MELQSIFHSDQRGRHKSLLYLSISSSGGNGIQAMLDCEVRPRTIPRNLHPLSMRAAVGTVPIRYFDSIKANYRNQSTKLSSALLTELPHLVNKHRGGLHDECNTGFLTIDRTSRSQDTSNAAN